LYFAISNEGKNMEFDQMKELLGVKFARYADFLRENVLRINLSPSAKILDIGTGYGTMAIVLASLGYEVTTGEPAEDKFADWKGNVSKVGLDSKIHFQPFEAETLPFSDNAFDAIFLYGTLHHIKNKDSTMQECFRCLKNKGWLVIFEFTPEGIALIQQENPTHPEAIRPLEYLENYEYEASIIKIENLHAFLLQKKITKNKH